MKNSIELERSIEQKQKELQASKQELQGRKGAFSNETEQFNHEISALDADLFDLKRTIKVPVILPILLVGVLAAALTAQFEFWTENQNIKIGLWVALIVVIIIRFVVGYKLNAPCRAIEAKIKESKKQIDAVESSDPNIARLSKEIAQLEKEIKKSKEELEDVKLTEELTEALENCILVHVKDAGGVDPRRVIIDGSNYGNAVKPFKLIPIERGIHSISLEFFGLENHMQTKDVQFMTSGAPKFFSYKIKYDINSKWVIDVHQPQTIDEFAKLVKMSKKEIKSFLLNL